MDVRAIMARLNVKNVRYNIGAGGIPNLTDQDVAAALGMVRDALGRGVLTLLWWPDGAALEREDIERQLRARMWDEFSRRQRAQQLARLDHHIAAGELAALEGVRRPSSLDAERREVARLAAVESAARAAAWPSQPERYQSALRAVLDEIRSPRHCSTCRGRGAVSTPSGPRVCNCCAGAGVRARSNCWRAERIGIDEAAFRRTWAGIYGWTHAMVQDLESSAARDFARALGAFDRDEVTA
jgi:hypothetical protein